MTQHLIRYGTHAESSFFLEEPESTYFDSMVINGNMMAYSMSAMSSFVLRSDKQFFLEPQTHAFQQDLEYLVGKNGEPKISLKKLSEQLGSKITDRLEKKESVEAADFSDDEDIVDLCEKTLEFQFSCVTNKLESSDEADYVNFALEDEESNLTKDNLKPSFLVAPYFYLAGENYAEWMNVNIRAFNKAKDIVEEKYSDSSLFAEIVVERQVLLDQPKLDNLISEYSKLDCAGYLIWIDSLVEDQASQAELEKLYELTSSLKTGEKVVINLYGGYFSLLLSTLDGGFDGVCHGLEYGEYRGVVPVGGGIPISKYYFPPVHKRLKYADLQRCCTSKGWGEEGANNEEFASMVCSCDQCKDLPMFGDSKLGKPNKKGVTRNYPTTDSKKHSLRHYLKAKNDEYQGLGDNLPDLISDLETAYHNFSGSISQEDLSHLLVWRDALNNIQPPTPD